MDKCKCGASLKNNQYNNIKICKKCHLKRVKKKNFENRKDFTKSNRPPKTKKELEKIKNDLENKEYMGSAVERLATIILRGIK